MASSPVKVAEEHDGALQVFCQLDFDFLLTLANSQAMDNTSESSRIEEPPETYYDVFTDTRASLRALNLAFADTVLENHRFGLPVIQGDKNGNMVKIPTDDLMDLALRIIETNGEPTPEQLRASGCQ